MSLYITTWSDERVDWLKRLWAEGHSGGQIARQMNCTRNAVIGKAHRLNLAKRESSNPIGKLARLDPEERALRRKARDARRDAQRRQGRPSRAGQPQPRRQLTHTPRPAPVLPPDCAPVTLMDLASIIDMPGTCRWPVLEATGAAQLFCGSGRDDIASSYCAYHSRLSGRQEESRPKRDRVSILQVEVMA